MGCLSLNRRNEQKFNFEVDMSHQSIKYFVAYDLKKNLIRRSDKNKNYWQKCISKSPLPSKGKHFYEVKLENCLSIKYGIVEESIKDDPDISDSKEQIYYWSGAPYIQNDGISTNVTQKLKITEKLIVMLDNQQHQVSWWIEGKKIGQTYIHKRFWEKKWYAFVCMCYEDSCVQLLND